MLSDPDTYVPPVLQRAPDAPDPDTTTMTAGPLPPSAPPTAPDPTPAPAPAPAPTSQDAQTMPADTIGDIPPPPVPRRPETILGPGVAGLPGTEAGTFARPGTAAVRPFRTPAYFSARPQRFGPGVPVTGGGAGVSGLADLGMGPDEAAELLRRLAGGGQ